MDFSDKSLSNRIWDPIFQGIELVRHLYYLAASIHHFFLYNLGLLDSLGNSLSNLDVLLEHSFLVQHIHGWLGGLLQGCRFHWLLNLLLYFEHLETWLSFPYWGGACVEMPLGFSVDVD